MEKDLFCPRSSLSCGVQFLPRDFLPELRYRSGLHHVVGSWIFRGLGKVPAPYAIIFRIQAPFAIYMYALLHTIQPHWHPLFRLVSGLPFDDAVVIGQRDSHAGAAARPDHNNSNLTWQK